MSKVMISYRRQGDAAGFAGRLYDSLVQRLGEAKVFRDVDTIRPGEDFIEAIENSLDSAVAVLAVIGPRWLTVTDDEGRARLEDPKDWVRLELSSALRRKISVLPILVDNAKIPAPEVPQRTFPSSRGYRR